MLPLALDVARLRVAVVGRGAAAQRRLRQLREAGARDVRIFSDAPEDGLRDDAGAALCRHLPDRAALAGIAVLFVCDLPHDTAATLAATAHDGGTLVNVEDDVALCDVHMPAIVRRGDLLLAVSTGGRSPGLAAALKRALETLFDADWARRVRLLADRRRLWRDAGRTPQEVGRLTQLLLDAEGWLPSRQPGPTIRRDAA